VSRSASTRTSRFALGRQRQLWTPLLSNHSSHTGHTPWTYSSRTAGVPGAAVGSSALTRSPSSPPQPPPIGPAPRCSTRPTRRNDQPVRGTRSDRRRDRRPKHPAAQGPARPRRRLLSALYTIRECDVAEVFLRSAPSVDLSAMPDAQHEDQQPLIVDFVADAVGAGSDSPLARAPNQLV